MRKRKQWEELAHYPPDAKPYHLAKLVDPNGRVSPLCATKPKALNLATDGWTLRPEAITCQACRFIHDQKLKFQQVKRKP